MSSVSQQGNAGHKTGGGDNPNRGVRADSLLSLYGVNQRRIASPPQPQRSTKPQHAPKPAPVIESLKQPAEAETPEQTSLPSLQQNETINSSMDPQSEIRPPDTSLSGLGDGSHPASVAQAGSGSQGVAFSLFGADYLNNPVPEYPPAARRLKLQGTVVVRVLISPAGTPEVVRLEKSSGTPLLDEAALKAVRSWSFVPARLGNDQISVWVDVPIRFRLE